MVNVEKIRVTQAADLANIPTTTADIFLVFDRVATLASGTLPFPANPIDSQTYTLSTKAPITNFSVDTAGRAISGVPTTLPIGVTGWVYDIGSDEWFPLTNPPITVAAQSSINSKLDTNGNGGSLTGLTASQVGLGNVDNTSDANKPISTAQQTALNAKQATLVSGTNIKTINGADITGSGNLVISGVNSTIVFLPADVINNNAVANTIADVTGLSFTVLANTTYRFRFFIIYSSAATTTGSRWSINGPATTFLNYRSTYTLTATSETVNSGLSSFGSPAASNASSLAANNIAIIEGIIRPSAGGTVIARFASEISSSAITALASGRSYVEFQIIN
jgi:hypothetical protein